MRTVNSKKQFTKIERTTYDKQTMNQKQEGKKHKLK